MTIQDLFFVTIWTALGGLMGFMVIGLIVNAEHWWQQRNETKPR